MNIPIEIFQIILSHTNFWAKIHLRCASKILYAKLEIHDFYNISKKYTRRLSDQILRAYPHITSLNAEQNSKITDVRFLTKLECLNASGRNCSIGTNGIVGLRLKELNLAGNVRVANLNFYAQLRNIGCEKRFDDWRLWNICVDKLSSFECNNESQSY